MGEVKPIEKENVPMVSNQEDILRIEKALENEIKEVVKLNKDIEIIKDLLIENGKKEQKKDIEIKKEQKLLDEIEEKESIKLQKEEEKANYLQEEKEEEFFSLLSLRHEELIETLSTPQEFESIKEELTLFNNNIVSIYESSLIFFGFVVAILISSIFLKGIFK